MQPGRDDMMLGRIGHVGAAGSDVDHDAGRSLSGAATLAGRRGAQPLPVPRPRSTARWSCRSEEDEGPPDGLTLDQAIELLVRQNLDLRAKYLRFRRRADVLTASLRANPIFYADSQLVPYGSDSVRRPDGPTQYDVNISHPIDYSHKRRARMAYAARALEVMEAQYQNEVRLAIQNLYSAYVDVLAARRPCATSQRASRGSTNS